MLNKKMKGFFKIKSNVIKLVTLGVLLIGLPTVLVLAQNQQIFFSQASVTDPAVTRVSFNPPSSNSSRYTPGQTVSVQITILNAGHFDAYFIDADANPDPNPSSGFTPIPSLIGRTSDTFSWTVPTTPGRYYFVVNVHKIAHGSGNDDWNPVAGDIGCAWNSKLYETPATPGQPLRDTSSPCNNVGKMEFWVGTATGPGPSPSSSINPSPSVATPVQSRNPFPVRETPVHLTGDCLETDFDCLPKDPIALTGSLYTVGLGLVGGVGVLFMIMGAYMVLTSQGDPTKLARGKSYIVYSIIGILLALFGYAFYQIIAVDILDLPGFSR